MNLKWIMVCGLLVTSSQAWSAEKTAIKTDKDKLSYSIGASIGKNLKAEKTDVDLNLLIKGLKTINCRREDPAFRAGNSPGDGRLPEGVAPACHVKQAAGCG